jgi:hypothetical protein
MSRSNISVGTQGWAERINAAWRKSALAYIETGQMLIECKKTVVHGDWVELLSGKLDFDERTAQRLMKIARDPRLSNPSNLSLLPKHIDPLYRLTKLSDDELNIALNCKTAPRVKPIITDAEYHDVTESPAGEPGSAVSAEGDGEIPPLATTEKGTTPLHGREGGDMRSSPWPDPERLDSFKAEDFDSSVTTDRAEGETPQAVARVIAAALATVMRARKGIEPAEAAELWPADMPMYSDDFDDFTYWLQDASDAFRKKYGDTGNDAALQAAE